MSPAQTKQNQAGSRIPQRLASAGRYIVVILAVICVMHGIATVSMGRKYEAAISSLKLHGDPVGCAELGGAKIADDQNAAVVYTQCFKYVYLAYPKASGSTSAFEELLKTRGILGKPCGIPPSSMELHKMVQATAAVIPIVKQAAAMPQCQFPVDWGAGWKATFPHYIPMRNLGKLLLAHALIAADEGRPQDAVDLVSLSLKVAKATRNEPTMISTLLLTSQTRNANRALQEIMRRCNLTNSQLDEVNNALNDTDYQREMLNGLKGDRASILQLYNSIISQGAAAYQELNAKSGDTAKVSGAASLWLRLKGIVWKPWLYSDAGYYMQYMNACISDAQQPYQSAEKRQKKLKKVIEGIPSYAVVAKQATPVYTGIYERVLETRAETALTQLLIMTIKYQRAYGHYPATIADLHNAHIGEVPKDPFTGQDMHYIDQSKYMPVAKLLFYSFGQDLLNNGGYEDSLNPTYTGDIVLNWELKELAGRNSNMTNAPMLRVTGR